jgi:hypothetical protein
MSKRAMQILAPCDGCQELAWLKPQGFSRMLCDECHAKLEHVAKAAREAEEQELESEDPI